MRDLEEIDGKKKKDPQNVLQRSMPMSAKALRHRPNGGGIFLGQRYPSPVGEGSNPRSPCRHAAFRARRISTTLPHRTVRSPVQTLLADHLHKRLQVLHARNKPLQLIIADRVIRRVARLDISPRQQLEAAAGKAGVARPGGNLPRIRAFGLRAQYLDAVRLWTVKGSD